MNSITYASGADASAATARVVDITTAERRLAEGRVTYRAADGKQKETYLGLPYSLLPRLFEASLAEARVLLYVWQRTGGWKDYHVHPQPVRITFAEWTGGRPSYTQDTGAHLCVQEITTTRDALVARGWLYEEWETPHVRGPRRYALIAPTNPGIGPYQREDGTWEVMLLTDEGPQPYQISESVLQHRKASPAILQHRKEALLQHRKACSTTQNSAILQHRKEKSRRAFPGQVPTQPITNSLANYSTKQDLAKGEAADAAPLPGEQQKSVEIEKRQTPPTFQHKGNAQLAPNEEKTSPPTAEFQAYQPALIAPLSLVHADEAEKKKATRSRRRSAASPARKIPPQNPLYAVWKTILPPATQRQVESLCTGLAELANEEKTFGHPVTPEELPLLMFQVMDTWKDGETDEHYTPTPRLLARWLDKIRREVQTKPSSRVRAWRALRNQEQAVQAADAALAEEMGEALVSDEGMTGAPADDIDPTWLASLRSTIEVHGAFLLTQDLWEMVCQEAHIPLTPSQEQVLKHVTVVWDAAAPKTLLVLARTSSQARYINSVLASSLSPQLERWCPDLTAVHARYVPTPQLFVAGAAQAASAAASTPQQKGDSRHAKQSGSDWSTPLIGEEAEGIIQC